MHVWNRPPLPNESPEPTNRTLTFIVSLRSTYPERTRRIRSSPGLENPDLRSILVVSSPPRIRRGLRPTGGGGFPFLLATGRREGQQRPDLAEGLDTTSFGEVRAIDIVPVTQKKAETECFTFRSGAAQVDVEGIIGRRIPRKRPAHSLAVRLDIRQRRSRNERK